MRERTNQEWLDELRGSERDEALADLRAFLVRGLGYAFASRSDVDEAAIEDFVPDMLIDPTAGPDQRATQRLLLETLGRLINTELTDKQRRALVAARVRGMPLEEVARRMGSNRNAMYKLLHDARQRLKKRMEAEGLSPDEMLAAFDA